MSRLPGKTGTARALDALAEELDAGRQHLDETARNTSGLNDAARPDDSPRTTAEPWPPTDWPPDA